MEIDFGRASNVARPQKYPVIRDLPRRKTDYDGFVASDAEAVIAQIQHQNAALHVTHPAVQNWGPGSWRTPWPDHRDAVAMGKRGDWYWGPSPDCKKMQYEPECSQNGAATA